MTQQKRGRRRRPVSTKSAPWLVVQDLAKALALTLFVFAFHGYLEKHSSGKSLRDFQFALLQEGLLPGALDDPSYQARSPFLPIVFDISKLHPNKNEPTDRNLLDAIIQEVDQKGAKAIGIDLEFAENLNTNALDRPEDYAFLARWNQKRSGHRSKVRVGVYRRALKRSEVWLGLPEFREMAAGIALPKDDPNHAFLYSRTCFNKQTQLPDHCQAGNVEGDHDLVQLPTALWEIAHDTAALPSLKQRATQYGEGPLLELGGYVIDYSYLNQIRSEIQVPGSPSDVPVLIEGLANAGRIRNRIVLIADLEDVQDQFCYTPHHKPLPGALIHACSIATLNRGMYREIQGTLSLDFEVGIVVFLILAIVAVRLVHTYYRPLHQWDYQYIEILAFTAMALLIYGAFKWRIRDVERVWPDFLWVSAALFIHPFLTEPFYRTCAALPKMVLAFARSFARRESGGNHEH